MSSSVLSLDYQSSWEEFQKTERVKELPIRIRLALRDEYFKPDHTVQLALKDLSSEVGPNVDVRIDWGALWNQLSTHFEDTAEFVPTISAVATSLVKSVQQCVTTDETWGMRLLDNVAALERETLGLYLLAPPKQRTTKALYLGQNGGLALKIPEAGPGTLRSISQLVIAPQLLSVFADAEKAEQTGAEPEWVGVGIDDVKVPQLGDPLAMRTGPDRFPVVDDLSGPDQLLDAALPYLATVTGRGELEVSCSHPRTMDFVATYLEAHARKNPNDTAGNTFLKVERQMPLFGTGSFTESVVVREGRTNWGLRATPMLALAVLQSKLGYELIHTDGITWVLKRNSKFAS